MCGDQYDVGVLGGGRIWGTSKQRIPCDMPSPQVGSMDLQHGAKRTARYLQQGMGSELDSDGVSSVAWPPSGTSTKVSCVCAEKGESTRGDAAK